MQTPAISQDKFPQNQPVQPATLGTLLEGAGLAENATQGQPEGLPAMPEMSFADKKKIAESLWRMAQAHGYSHELQPPDTLKPDMIDQWRTLAVSLEDRYIDLEKRSGQAGDMASAIRAITGRGWQVVPVDVWTKDNRGKFEKKALARWGGKADLQEDGTEFPGRTANTEKALQWLARWPNMGLAIATGGRSQNNQGQWLLLLDFDKPEYWQAFCDLCNQNDFDLSATYVEKSPNGWHCLFFARPDLQGVGTKSKIQISPSCELDTRWQGGYFITAPSVNTDGGKYEVLHDCQPAKLPGWLEAMLTKDKPVQPEQGQRDQRQGNLQMDLAGVASFNNTNMANQADKRVRKWALAILDSACRDLAQCQQGGRNDCLNSTAYRLGQLAGLDKHEIEARLISACKANGLLEQEPAQTRRTIAETLAKALTMPRQYPPDKQTDKPATKNASNQTGQSGSTASEPDPEDLPPTPFAKIELVKCTGGYYAFTPPPPIETIFAGMVKGTLGGIVAAPGTGKSTMLAQAVALAGGAPWLDTWEIEDPLRVLVMFAEDPAEIVHRRIQLAIMGLPAYARQQAMENFFAVPLRGNVALIDDVAGNPKPNRAFADFRRLVDEIKPDLIFLDTYGKFISLTNENNNTAITAAMSLLDDYCYKTGQTIILTHHTDKLHSRSGTVKDNLTHVLSQVSARGGTGFAASVRWLLTMLPLKAVLAEELISDRAGQMEDDTFVAMKVTKTNYGPQGGTFYLQHMENGLFQPVKPEKQEKKQASLQELARRLVEIVKGRQEAGLEPLSFSKGIAKMEQYKDPDTGQAWGLPKFESVRQYAIDNGLLKPDKRDKGKGQILVLGDKDILFS